MGAIVLAKGNLKVSGDAFEVRTLGPAHIQEMLALQETVAQTLEDTAALQPLSRQEFEYILSKNGFIIGAYKDDHMIAFRAMLVPPLDDPEHLGIIAGIKKQALQKVIYSEITVVDPDFRGNGLQTYMGKVAMDEVDEQRFPYVIAMVAPFNIPSLKDKLALGMNIVGLVDIYQGKLRYVFFKDLTKESNPHSIDTRKVNMGATAVQQSLIREGYIGTAIEQTDDTYHVLFRR